MTRLPACNGIDPSLNADFALGQGPREGDADIVSLKHDEQKIACMLGAVDLTLDRCELTGQHTSRLLLCWLLSSKPGAYQPKPFVLEITSVRRPSRWQGVEEGGTFYRRSCLYINSGSPTAHLSDSPDSLGKAFSSLTVVVFLLQVVDLVVDLMAGSQSEFRGQN
ncbi:hypothetical protein AUP68_11197 [Ilyonectria robusta]